MYLTMDTLTKRCRDCQTDKPIEDFYARSDQPGKHQSYCKVCFDVRRKPSTAAQHRRHSAAYRDRNLVACRAAALTHYHERGWQMRLERKYGLRIGGYDEMFVKQGGCCAICRGDNGGKRLAVDHDHATGRVRGLCCTKCNRAIGLLGDSAEAAERLASYLGGMVQ